MEVDGPWFYFRLCACELSCVLWCKGFCVPEPVSSPIEGPHHGRHSSQASLDAETRRNMRDHFQLEALVIELRKQRPLE